MKKLLLFAMIILPSMLSAQTVSGLKVETAAGTPSTVTFDVSWSAASLTTPWLDSMWVFVDYNKNGKMTRMPITGGTLTAHSANTVTPSPLSPDAGTVIKIAGNDKGVWVVGDARTNAAGSFSFSAIVQLYTDETTITGACAYASSYPPVGDWLDETKIAFNGTPMYEITLTPSGGGADEIVEAGSTFLLPCSYTVSSFTDATGAPGIINCLKPTGLTLASTLAMICPGESTTLTASASGAASYSINGTDWYASPVFGVSPASTTPYTLYAKTDKGCVASVAGAAMVSVNPKPTGLLLTATPAVICNGESTTLTASATGAASYSIGNNVWQTTTAFNVSPAANTSYTLYAKTMAGCTASLDNAAMVPVNPVPTVTDISPAYGMPTGGTAITITGTNFMAGATVTIGGTACTGVTVNSSTGITCITPAKAEGTYPVVVTTGYCTSNTDITFTHVNSMQEFTAANCEAMEINEVIILTDIRNNKTYHIIRLKMSADGSNDRCWMQENLAIAGMTITSENSNVTTDFTIPALTPTVIIPNSGDYVPNNPVYYDAPPYNAAPYGYLYTWPTAIAYSTAQYGTGSNNNSQDINSGNAAYSICPKGWRLPTGGTDKNTNEFSLVDIHSYGGTGVNRYNDVTVRNRWIAPAGFAAVYAGHIYFSQFLYRGTVAQFWSASVYNDVNAYCLYLTGNGHLSG
jgi:uncharacterized protein (TIGR02145 family)